MFRLASRSLNLARRPLSSYAFPVGGHPPQSDLLTSRAKFTDAYVMIPKTVLRDIVTSPLPHWDRTRCWVLARPLTGFAETFSQYIVEVGPGGGSSAPEPNANAEGVLFVLSGELAVEHGGATHVLEEGGFAFLPPGARWTCANASATANATFVWVRKRYERCDGVDVPEFFVASDKTTAPTPMPDTNGAWATTRFVGDPASVRPGDSARRDATRRAPPLLGRLGRPPSRHALQHRHLQTWRGHSLPRNARHGTWPLRPPGQGRLQRQQRLDRGRSRRDARARREPIVRPRRDDPPPRAGDFIWMRAFCPQACYAGGPEDFRYLLYKDVNRHAKLPF